jgi:ribosomal-protein-alanine N-acetyltransferase
VTPAELSHLHRRVFTHPRPFTEAEFADFLSQSATILCSEPQGFVLGRVIGEEAEVVTLAVDPGARRQGIARRLMAELHRRVAERSVQRMFLEVDAGNAAARGLYAALGYAEAGRRPAYYRQSDGTRSDALILRCEISAAS